MSLSDRERARFEREIAAAFAHSTQAAADAILQALGDPPNPDRLRAEFWDGLEARMRAEIEPVVVQALIASAAGLAVETGFSPERINQRAADWARQYTFDLVKGITDTSRDKLQLYVSDFFKTPAQDLKALGERIADLFGPVRGEMIATTEATRAASEGEQLLLDEIKAAQPDARVAEFWQTSADEIVCPVCRPLNGVRGDGRGNFKRGGKTYRLPAHPRCRCTRRIEIIGLETANA